MPNDRPLLTAAAFVLIVGALFSAAYGQAPLYYSNQNQYFLHGLAAAGDGVLADDWLAQTADPTPLFSGLVHITARFAHPWLFHLYHAILLGAYAGGLCGVFAFVVGPEVAAKRWPIFLAALIAVHAALGRWLSYQVFGLDVPWYFQAGVAGQYVLGAMLQPSVFGVLLVVAVSQFIHGRPNTAVFLIAAAATIHSTYLLPGALLTAGFLAAHWRDGDVRGTLKLGGLALALVMPVTIFVALRFRPTTNEAFREAQDILVNIRIPHHCRPDLWFDAIAALQLAWIALALVFVRRSRLFPTLATPFVLAIVLTLIQVATGNLSLALVFPWRVSAVLMPIATAILLSRLVALPRLPFDGKSAVAFTAIFILAMAGLWINLTGRAFRSSPSEAGLLDFVRSRRSKGDVYLVPVRIPKLAATTRGSLSSDFKPVAAKQTDSRLIPIDLQRFRLSTGAPIYVDFKSIPYQDGEVIAWYDRLQKAERWHRMLAEGKTNEAFLEMRHHGVTHVVQPAASKLDDPDFRLIFSDGAYQVLQIKPPAPQ